jgi:Na+/proline symporter
MGTTGVDVGLWGWVWIAAFLALFVGIGIYGMRKTKTGDDFAVARGAYGPYLLVFALAATVASGSTFMGIPGLAYSKGFPAIWYPAIYPIGIYAGLILAIKLIKRAGDRFRSGSIPDFMGQRYDSDFLRIGFALLSLLLIYYVTAQIVAAATMFEVMLGVGYRGGILLSVGVVALYITIGGSHADIMTDGIQGILMTIIALGIAAVFFLGLGVEGAGPGAINRSLVAQDPALGWDHYFSPGDPIFGTGWLVLLMFIAHLPFAMNPHIGKLAFSLKDSSQLRVFLMLAIPIGSILGFTVLGGLHARALVGPDIRPDAAIPVLFTQIFPPMVAGFLGVGILSAIMSTADGLFIAIAVIFSNDLYRRTLAPRIHADRSPEQIDRIALWISRIATVLVALAAIALAWNPPEFLAVLLWIGVGGIVSGAAGPLVVGSLWRRATRPAAIASFLTGVLLYAAFWLVIGWRNPFGAAGVCVTVASLVMVVVSLLTKPMDPELLDRIFNPEPREAWEPAEAGAGDRG